MSAAIDVAIVGGGPAGLAAAVASAPRARPSRSSNASPSWVGSTRHADHTGYGLHEFKRPCAAPSTRVGGRIASSRRARRCAPARPSRAGRATERPHARADLTCRHRHGGGPRRRARTGTCERPRSARLVPGARPGGVLTTGSLQQLAAAGLPVGRSAVIVGAEHVSFSAVLTLAHAGCRTVGIVTPEPRCQTYGALRVAAAGWHRAPVLPALRCSGSAAAAGHRRRRDDVATTSAARSSATPSSSPATGCPTTPWPDADRS